jgi:hypothetical protein
MVLEVGQWPQVVDQFSIEQIDWTVPDFWFILVWTYIVSVVDMNYNG